MQPAQQEIQKPSRARPFRSFGPEGSIYALIGPNGAGKTTLIKTLVNILRPSSGSASILGIDSRKLSPKEFAQLGYVSENQEMPEWMTVGYLFAQRAVGPLARCIS